MIVKYLKNKEIRQSVLLLSTTVAVMVLLLATNYFLTRVLGKTEFGNYALIINIFTFCQVVFNFGFFYSISRLIALSDQEAENRELYAIGLILVLTLFVLMSVCLVGYVLFFGGAVGTKTLTGIMISIPFAWIFLFNSFNELLLQGSNKIELLSFSRFFPKAIFLVVVIPIYFVAQKTSITPMLLCFFASSIIPFLYIIIKLRPRFKNLKKQFLKVIESNKKFGFNIYLGSLFAVGASSLSGILIGYFGVDNTEVGYYSIALQLSAPLSLIPNVMATVFFKKFSGAAFIEPKLSLSMYLTSAFVLIIILLLAKPVILILYGSEYLTSVVLVYYLAVSSTLYGVADFYNKFMLSKGKGVELRNASFIVGLTLLVSNLVLIKILGATGAAISTILSGLAYLLALFYYFNSAKKEIIQSKSI